LGSFDDVDRPDFIKTLAEACQKTGWQVPAYCLMPNHCHVVLETPEPNGGSQPAPDPE
jgi:putative transposase